MSEQTIAGQASRAEARAGRITNAILDAGLRVLAQDGWQGFTLSGVGAAAGYSKRPVHNRYNNRTQLAIDVWQNRCWDTLQQRFSTLIGALREARATGNAEPLYDAFEYFMVHDNLGKAATELLVQCLFDAELNRAVEGTFTAMIREHCDVENSLNEATRNSYVIALACGIALASRSALVDGIQLRDGLEDRVEALLTDIEPQPLPPLRAVHLDRAPVLDANSKPLNALLNAVLDLMGQYGYYQVTVQQVAKAAGYTEGLIFAHYKTKMDLFFDAIRRANEFGFQASQAFYKQIGEQYGDGIADAVQMVEAVYPGRELRRAIVLERVRVTWHEPELQKSIDEQMFKLRDSMAKEYVGDLTPEFSSRFFVSYAAGLGMGAIATQIEHASELPWDIISVPLQQIQSSKAGIRLNGAIVQNAAKSQSL